MNVTLLSSPPMSGKYKEYVFGIGPDFVWVLFEQDDLDAFCGVFEGGEGTQSDVVAAGELAFILALGRGYVFSLPERSLEYQTASERLVLVSPCGAQERFVACSSIELFIYGRNGLLWSSGRVSSDGIEINRIEGCTVFGRVYNFIDWVDFTLNTESFQYSCEWSCEIP